MYTYSGCVGCGLGQSSADLVPRPGYGQAEEDLAGVSFTGLESQGEAELLGQAIASLAQQLGGITSMAVYQNTGETTWNLDVWSTAFLVTSPTTITSPWVDDSDYLSGIGEELLDAVGEGFIELVRSVDDVNRSLEIASSNHRIDMGSIVLESSGGESRFSVTVYPPVGTAAPEEELEPTGPVEPSEKRPGWFIPVGIGAGVLSIAGVVGAVIWSRKKR